MIVYVPRAVVLFDERFRVTLPDPGKSTLEELRVATTPDEEVVKVTFPANPFRLFKVTGYCLDAPAGKLWGDELTVIPKSCTVTWTFAEIDREPTVPVTFTT